ncbi:MAG TPA: hypothetical protein VMW47_09535 [Verrucomicrobiae bacterium]|nr:hypothetical protein [Verrucomicrobiae bacterium]
MALLSGGDDLGMNELVTATQTAAPRSALLLCLAVAMLSWGPPVRAAASRPACSGTYEVLRAGAYLGQLYAWGTVANTPEGVDTVLFTWPTGITSVAFARYGRSRSAPLVWGVWLFVSRAVPLRSQDIVPRAVAVTDVRATRPPTICTLHQKPWSSATP